MWYSIAGIVLSFFGKAFSLWKILMRDERIAGTWRDIPNLHKNAVKAGRLHESLAHISSTTAILLN